jgi:hypothetical protein
MSMTDGSNDGGGGGLGTAGSICTISPEDTTAVLGNLISRIEKLEFNLSQILGANLHAEQLSDLSSQVGWVYGVEYMGVPGWIQTEYGTLIPPAGFTLSSSGFQMFNSCTGEYEDYQGVQMDSDGVLQFGFTSKGNVCGSKAEYWDAGGAAQGAPTGILAYADFGWHNNSFYSTPALNISLYSSSRSAGAGTIRVSGMTSGQYFVIGNATQYATAGGTAGAIINGLLDVGTVPGRTSRADTSGVITTTAGNVAREAATVSAILEITSTSQQIILGWAANILDGTCTFPVPYDFNIQLIRIA